MSEKLTPFDEFMEALPCCDTVKVILTGCGESVFETKPIYEGICKLANRRADAVPVVRGEWERMESTGGLLAICSACKYPVSWWYKSRFCPSCGAKMEDKPCG